MSGGVYACLFSVGDEPTEVLHLQVRHLMFPLGRKQDERAAKAWVLRAVGGQYLQLYGAKAPDVKQTLGLALPDFLTADRSLQR